MAVCFRVPSRPNYGLAHRQKRRFLVRSVRPSRSVARSGMINNFQLTPSGKWTLPCFEPRFNCVASQFRRVCISTLTPSLFHDSPGFCYLRVALRKMHDSMRRSGAKAGASTVTLTREKSRTECSFHRTFSFLTCIFQSVDTLVFLSPRIFFLVLL